MPASSERSCRCSSVACSGTRSTNTWPTALPSGASKGIGCFGRTKAASVRSRPLMRPCGMAMPWPRPVEPSFSRAKRLSNTVALAICSRSSNSCPTCSKSRFLLVASMSSRMFASGSSCAIWFTRARRILQAGGRSLSTRAPYGRMGRKLYAARRLAPPGHGRGARPVGARRMAAAVALFLLLDHLAVQLVGERVDRRVHVCFVALGVDVLAPDVQVRGDLLSQLVDREHDGDVDDVIEMPRQPRKLLHDVVPDRRSDLEMMAAETQVHRPTSSRCTVLALRLLPRHACRYTALRTLTGGICSASRYLAIVRRATRMP